MFFLFQVAVECISPKARLCQREAGHGFNRNLLASIAEKVETAKTERLLHRYAANLAPEAFEQNLAQVPDVEHLPGDEL
jgi:hypothetical protein